MVAFSNAKGGVIFVGVGPDGEVKGKRLDQPSEDKVHEAAFAARDPGRYRVSSVIVAGVEIMAISVEKRIEGFAQRAAAGYLSAVEHTTSHCTAPI